MKPDRTVGPSITQVLREFLDEQAERLGKRTLGKYKTAIELLQAYLDSYAYQYLNSDEMEMLESYKTEKGEDEYALPFCSFFGPEKIPCNVEGFLGYFIPHKVACGADQLRTSGTALKRLARWLAERGYIDLESADSKPPYYGAGRKKSD